MRALIIEHDAYTHPGPIGEALVARGYELERRLVVPAERFDSPDVDHEYPDPTEYDVIVPMGAPWSVTDHAKIGPWVRPELQMLAQAHHRGIPVLGICFGGQAMAAALGGAVVRARGWELGWTTVDSRDHRLVPPGPWFQFHRDAMIPPEEADVVAENDWGVQAWRSRATLAVQFHPELTATTLQGWLDNGAAAVLEAEGLDPAEVLQQTIAEQGDADRRAEELVDAFLTGQLAS